MKRLMQTLVCLSLFSLVTASAQPSAAGEVPPNRWAVIFAPVKYSGLPASPLHATGATELKQRLTASGFDPERVVLLSNGIDGADRPATKAELNKILNELTGDGSSEFRAEKGDVILVAVCSYGVRIDGADYVCSADSTTADLTAVTAGDSLTSVKEILKTLSANTETHDLVIIDAAGTATIDGAAQQAGDFGRTAPPHASGQAVILGRSSQVRTPDDDSPARTWFMQSVLDGFSQLADKDQVGGVTVLEFQEYLGGHTRTVSQVDSLTSHEAPQAAVAPDDDFSLVAAGRVQPAEVSPEFEAEMGLRMINLAERALLLEQDAEGAARALTRIARFGLSKELASRAESLLWMTLAMQGQVQVAWDKAAEKKRPLFVVAPRSFSLYQQTNPIKAGTVLQITRLAPNQGVTWAKVSARFGQEHTSGTVELTKLEAEEGWTNVSQLTAKNSSDESASNEDLTVALKKLFTPPAD